MKASSGRPNQTATPRGRTLHTMVFNGNGPLGVPKGLSVTSPLLEIATLEKAHVSSGYYGSKVKTYPTQKYPHQYRPDAEPSRVAKITSLFAADEKTKELESIIALKTRQILRLQKEAKNLMQIQQQQAKTIASTYDDARELEDKLHSTEQRQRVDERTMHALQEKLNEVTAQYNRLLSKHISGGESSPPPVGPGTTTIGAKLKAGGLPVMGRSSSQRAFSEPIAGSVRSEASPFITERRASVDSIEDLRPASLNLRPVVEFLSAVVPMEPKDTNVFGLLGSELCKLLAATRATVYILDRHRGELLHRTTRPKDSKYFRISVGDGLTGIAAATGIAVRCLAPMRDARFNSAVDDRSGLKPSSILCYPVHLSDHKVVGVLQLLSLHRPFTTDDEEILRNVERGVANVMANYLLHQHLRKEIKKHRRLTEACQLISAELDIGSLSATISTRAAAVLKAESCLLYLIDGGSKELCLISTDREEHRFGLDRGIVGHVACTGNDIIVHDAAGEPLFDPEVDQAGDKPTRSLICSPIKNTAEDILGVVVMMNKKQGFFNDNDLEMLHSLNTQVFDALSNAELFHKTLSGFNAALITQQKYQSLLEVAELLSSQLDEDELINFVMKRAREMVNSERCSLFLVDHTRELLVSKVAEGTEAEIKFPISVGIAGHVATTGETLNIIDAYKDPRFNEAVDKQTGFQTNSILCMPIYNEKSEEIIGVTQLINKRGGLFTKEDEEVLRAFSIFCGIALRNAALYKQAIQSQHKTKALLDVAVALSSETNIQPLLRSIMKHARRLVKADRFSLFMLDPDNKELRSQVAEGTEEIRLPMHDGIVGYVASTGEEVNVADAYKDPRFNPVIDRKTGYHTKSVLCLPIRNGDGDVIAVTQMINKREGAFHQEDTQLLKAFAAFAEKSLASVKTIPQASPQAKRSYMVNPKFVPTDDDRRQVLQYDFDVWNYTHEGLIRCVIAMFEHFDLINTFAVPYDRLINFLTELSATYREVPYHNFFHAIDVTQTVFYFLVAASSLSTIFSPVEILAILVAALCHDVDHGGVNNAYHVKAQTPLALLYKDMSVLETHHCSRAITMLSETENDIFSGLTDQQYSLVWKVMISSILATDMSLHFNLVGKFEALVDKGSFDVEELDHRKLLASMLLKCGDISNVCKPFGIARRWAEILCSEFFMQGDLEKAKGLELSPLMDRSNVVIPQMQLGFINLICAPLFKLLSTFMPDLVITLDTLKSNAAEWSKILQKGMATPRHMQPSAGAAAKAAALPVSLAPPKA
eukprot:TRINITY_DN5788_c0_g1_i1.p1 TRINITY_DN5788_c0_g1~~TRINITY_DN5788_c0_g1_i1.p1  ORF type:complete len:1275 (+),score=428.42 TRINITY_DN5788_c0_g1_i1:108-3932(+)